MKNIRDILLSPNQNNKKYKETRKQVEKNKNDISFKGITLREYFCLCN